MPIDSTKLNEILAYKGYPGRVIALHSSKSVTLEMLDGPLKDTLATVLFKNLKREGE